MTEITLDILRLEEGLDLECKRATGRDGRGAVPLSLYETYYGVFQ